MDIHYIQGFIKENLFKKDGSLNTKRIEGNGKWLFKYYRDEYYEILKLTQFLDSRYESPSFSQRIWHIFYNKFYLMKCEWCETEVVSFNWFTRGYFRFCCPKCASYKSNIKRKETYDKKSEEEKQKVRDKQRKSHLSKTENEQQETMERRKKTNIEKFGVDNPSKNSEMMNEIIKRRFKLKEYKLPSGKVINLQGYEPQALDMLLEIYEEKDIWYEVLNMPEIWYKLNDIWHRYYPDFYIPKDNLIVEVKCPWTLNQDYDINMAKFESVENYGFKFKLIIIEK